MKNRLLKPIKILLVENNPGDLLLIEKEFKFGKLSNGIDIVKDTYEALEYINKNSISECPDLVLINLSMPPAMEAKVIKELIENENCNHLNIIILTNDEVEEDILVKSNLNYEFLRRPFNIQNFISIITSNGDFSISIIKHL